MQPLLLPWVAAAKALGQLDHLGCLLSKQTNATSIALSGLLSDVETVRHATLQNRAEIDFLFLVHGHGCEDFEGMCCMNLSSHIESVQKSIQVLKEGYKKLQVEDKDWFKKCFKDWRLKSWALSVVKTRLLIHVIIIVVLLIVPCLFTCFHKILQKSFGSNFLIK